ncbi:DUF4345 family protein [Phenylobacterium sp.]|uniref:DUF4345 family protein n=1 Tax=Phenylobacterium sp. TaxID=1871053 RepID=UPI00398379D8
MIAVAGLVPVGAGLAGALGGIDGGANGQLRYLSGLLLGIGLTFWWAIPTLERRGAVIRALAIIVVTGGLARLAGAFTEPAFDTDAVFPLTMELCVTPAIAFWRERVQRRVEAAALALRAPEPDQALAIAAAI